MRESAAALSNPSDANLKDVLESFLNNRPQIKVFRLQYVDYCGLLRERLVPKKRILDLSQKGEHIQIVLALLLITPDGSVGLPASECPEVSTYSRLIPDESSLKELYYCPGHARSMVFVVNTNLPLCPRLSLARHLNEFNAKQITFNLGFEVEFYLLNLDDTPISQGGSSVARAMSDAAREILEETIDIIANADIAVEQFHSEAGPGQFEISLGPSEILKSIDDYLYTVETISHVARRRNAKFTMHPKPFGKGTAGTGVHLNLSIKDGAEGVQEAFFRGVYDHMPALCAILMPSTASYTRLTDPIWSPCFGKLDWKNCLSNNTNKNEPLRRKTHLGHVWEFRCVDATANMFLVLSAILCAGYLGYVGTGHAEGLNNETVSVELPTNLDSALDALYQDTDLKTLLGPEISDTFIRCKKTEIQQQKILGEDA